MEKYSEKLIDHFINPRGVGEINDTECKSLLENEEDSVTVAFFIKLEDKILKDVKYKVSGCSALISTCSAIYELCIGMSIKDALVMSIDKVSEYLDIIPESKLRCSQYGVDAFKMALEKCG